jgi:hypothetical protein
MKVAKVDLKPMKDLSGELVELDFNFGTIDRTKALAKVIQHCCEHGGIFAGKILQCEGPDAGKHRYSSIADRTVRRLSVDSTGLSRKLTDADVDVVSAAVWSAIGISDGVPEVITYCGVSSDASLVDNPSISIRGEGWVFSTPGQEKQARKAGRHCYEKFIEICSALDPDYASILNEDSLPCSYDLANGVGKRCFANFFVSARAYDAKVVSVIEHLFSDAYLERLPNGIYVSTWSYFNPGATTIERKIAIERSAKVAGLLGRR